MSENNGSPLNLLEQDNFEVAYDEAVSVLEKSDIDNICRNSGTQVISENESGNILLTFLGDDYFISFPEVSINYKNKSEEIPLWVKILLLHYLIYAKGTIKTGEEISFKQLEGGMGYFPAFQKRTIGLLIDKFGDNLENFIKAGEIIGGVQSSFGDYALTFKVFPKVSVTFIFWKGDEEFPSEGNIVFDSTIADYLTTEDVAVLCNLIAVMMIKEIKK